ncbi:MAG: phosphatidylserine decarboxylase [Elusimicrobia bacterium]|nr:MAG: phosphatidylserine decarboxylase [Elusimicrobiota bacterium]KAF0156444.1 MAG: phosphatidylserine decarboxylase [Elusimicrobiota bacterium]
MNLAPAGWKILIVTIAITGLGGLVAYWCRWCGVPLLVLGLLLTAFSAYFFRDPERDRTFGPDDIICPADGTVLSVGREDDPGVLVVRIFLSVFNVHVQRAPLAGTVEKIKYEKGAFAVAYKPEARVNERNLIRINGGNGRWAGVEQITGAIARRIACYVKEGQAVSGGERIGMIYFGSQVAVYLPKGSRALVKAGDKVAGAETILGIWKAER